MFPAALLLLAVHSNPIALNDAWMGYNGSPRLMAGHPSVRMVSEVVRITIHRRHMIVDASFVFKNDGRAASVRMGFPDFDSDSYVDPKGPRTIYDWFHAYVDGKRVQTKLVGNEKGEAWQIKTVAFRAGQSRRVTNRYSQKLDDLALSGRALRQPAISGASYIFYTGRSWKGTIGRTEVIVTFTKDAAVGSGALKLFGQTPDTVEFWKPRPNAVSALGPSQPTLNGRTIRFLRTNWEPESDEQLTVRFGYRMRPPDPP